MRLPLRGKRVGDSGGDEQMTLKLEFRTPKTLPPTAGYHHVAVVPAGVSTV
jgi:hypothetical protein